MINYDSFMIADSDRGISRLKLNGILNDIVDFDIFKVSPQDIRLNSNSKIYPNSTVYVSLLHSRYTYQYIREIEMDIIHFYTTDGYFTLHKGLIIGDYRYPNTMISYREPDLVERLIDNGIL